MVIKLTAEEQRRRENQILLSASPRLGGEFLKSPQRQRSAQQLDAGDEGGIQEVNQECGRRGQESRPKPPEILAKIEPADGDGQIGELPYDSHSYDGKHEGVLVGLRKPRRG